MKLPNISRYQKQNYPSSPDWFTRFLGDLNNFTETIWSVLNKNITVGDNLDAQVFTFTILAGAAAINNTQTFTPAIKHVPQAVVVGYCADSVAYGAALSTAVYVSWAWTGSQIQIQSITGLTSGHTYTVTLVVL